MSNVLSAARAFSFTGSVPHATQQEDTRHSIQQALRDHHVDNTAPEAHPDAAFNIPSWSGSPKFSAAALLGGAPV